MSWEYKKRANVVANSPGNRMALGLMLTFRKLKCTYLCTWNGAKNCTCHMQYIFGYFYMFCHIQNREISPAFLHHLIITVKQCNSLISSPPENTPKDSAASTNSACRPARNGTPSSCQLTSISSLKRSFDDLAVIHSYLYETFRSPFIT